MGSNKLLWLFLSTLLATGAANAVPAWADALSSTTTSNSPVSGTGVFSWGRYTNMNLDSLMDLKVNDVNGNTVLTLNAIDIPGVNGLDEQISPTYNSLSIENSDISKGWTLGTGSDVHLVISGSTVTFIDPTGADDEFTQQSDGSYQPSSGVNAQLVKNADGTYSLSYNNGIQYDFNSAGLVTSLQNQQGNNIAYDYNSSNELTNITNTEGQSTSISYNSNNQVSEISDSAGETWTFSYDSNGDLTKFTDANGAQTSFSYDNSNNLTTVTDPLGRQTDFTYNSTGQVTKIVRVTDSSAGTGATWSFAYYNAQTNVSDPNGNITLYLYNANDQVTQITDPEGHTQTYNWTANNQISQQSEPSGGTTNFSYNSSNDLTKEKDPSGSSSTMQYQDPNNPYEVTSNTDQEGNQTNYTYTSQGLLSSVEDALGNKTTYSYNSSGSLTSVTDPNNNNTTYTYNNQGLLSQTTYPSPLGITSFTYNSSNRIASETDGNGNTTSYTYDGLGDITQISYADGSSVTYQYDADGNLSSMTDGSGTTTYQYDALNDLVQETLPNGQTIKYTWDGNGNMLSKTDQGGPTTYKYSPDNQVTSVTDPNGATTTLSYDNNGNEVKVEYPNGVTETKTYNNSNQLTNIASTDSSGKTLTSYTYSYTDPSTGDATGQIYKETDTNGNVTTYQYDGLNRLTNATITNSSGTVTNQYQYTYDNAGNMLSETHNGSTTYMTYNAANELTAVGSTDYGYDANGNLISGRLARSIGQEPLSISYNDANQTTMIQPEQRLTANLIQYSMSYRGTGQTERTAEGDNTFQNDITGISAETTSAGTSYFTRTPEGQLISERVPTGTYYYLMDGMGSVVALVNSSGTVVNQYQYDPYGTAISANETVSNPFRWIGALYDSDTGFYKIGARYYSPAMARWTQLDPSMAIIQSNPQSLNLYTYGQDNPINNIDITGTTWFNVALDIIGIGLGVLGIWWDPVGWIAMAAAAAELGYDAYLLYRHKITRNDFIVDIIFTLKGLAPWAWISWGTGALIMDIVGEYYTF